MSNDTTTGRRTRVERNIYRRETGVYEVGFRDSSEAAVADGRGRHHRRSCPARPAPSPP